MTMKGTPYYDMARDAGYKGAEAEQMAAALEADHRKLMQLQEQEREQERERNEHEAVAWRSEDYE